MPMERARILPPPHRYAICADDCTSIKEFYKGVFEEVFVIFHPFIQAKSIDYEFLCEPDNEVSRNEIHAHCERVSWKQFMGLSGIESFRQLDVGLRSNIYGISKQFLDESIAKIIRETCDRNKMVVPDEGFFPYFIMDELLRAIKELGHDWMWLGDEFCTQ